MWPWILLGLLVSLGVGILAGKCIKFGTAENEDDYMIGDDEFDWGDKE